MLNLPMYHTKIRPACGQSQKSANCKSIKSLYHKYNLFKYKCLKYNYKISKSGIKKDYFNNNNDFPTSKKPKRSIELFKGILPTIYLKRSLAVEENFSNYKRFKTEKMLPKSSPRPSDMPNNTRINLLYIAHLLYQDCFTTLLTSSENKK